MGKKVTKKLLLNGGLALLLPAPETNQSFLLLFVHEKKYLLIAQAISENFGLVTADLLMARYPGAVRRV